MSLISEPITPASSLGLASDQVFLIDYHPSWPELYSNEVRRLVPMVKTWDLYFEHIGSTAVPGLRAKPIIDIMIGHKDPSHVSAVSDLLERAGYENLGELGIPDRWFFALGEPRTVHVHLVPFGEKFWHEHILFRDELIRNPAAAEEYLLTKLNLAAMYPGDRQSYTDGKADIIMSILNRVATRKENQ